MVYVKEKKEEIKEEPKQELKWIVSEVPDTYKPAIVDNENKEIHTVETALCKVLNCLEELKKLLG